MHHHSIHAARASLAFEQRFKITGIEMQKGIPGYDVFDLLHVPIIENVSHEKDLAAHKRRAEELSRENVALSAKLRSFTVALRHKV